MAQTDYQVTFAGVKNQGSQIGHNSGSVENHFHYSTKRIETPPSPSLLIPFQRDDDFVERSELLGQIYQQCSVPGSRTALVGLGGVGKSQLAIEYAYRVQDQSSETWIFWVHASNAVRFEQSFRDIADEAKIFGWRDPKANIFKLVHDWLRSNKRRWILILDNVDDARFLRDTVQSGQQDGGIVRPLRDYLPRSTNGSILITSRSREAVSKLVAAKSVINIAPMSEVDALTLFERKLGRQSDPTDIAKLAAALEFMPLAIVHAAAYIRNLGLRCSVREYLTEFRKNDNKKTSILRYDGEDEDEEFRRDREARNSILITWQISFSRIQQTVPSAADLLSLMSFFDRESIHESLLRNPGAEKGGHESDTNDDENDGSQSSNDDYDFKRNVKTLYDFSFIAILDTETFKMHGLVQLATRKWLKAQGQLERWKQQCIRNLDAVFPTGEFENWDKCRLLFPHAKSVAKQRPEAQESLTEWASVLYKAAWYALRKMSGAEAAEMAVKAMKTRNKLFGWEDEATLASMEIVGSVYSLQGRWKEAEELQVQVMKTRKRVLGAKHPDTLTSIANLASTYRNQGRWKEAEELEVQVMETSKRVLSAEHPSTLTSMANLASTLRNQGRWKEAEELQVQVMETRKRVLGAEHPSTLTSIANLASTLWNQGLWKEAEELQVQVIETSKRVLGAEHPSTLTSIANLASTLWNQGRWKEAEELEVQVMETRKRVFGAQHPHTLASMNNLAVTYRNQGRGKEAEELEVQVIETSKRVLGAQHPDTLTSMNNLAVTYRIQGRWKEAEELQVQVMETRKRVLSAEHPSTLNTMANLAFTWKDQGQSINALKLLEECLQLRTHILGTTHPDTLSTSETLLAWKTEGLGMGDLARASADSVL